MYVYCNNNPMNNCDPYGQMMVGVLQGGAEGIFGGSGCDGSTAISATATAPSIQADTKENVEKRFIQQISYTFDYVKDNWKDMVDITITAVSFREALVGFITTPKSVKAVGALLVAIWGIGRQFEWW